MLEIIDFLSSENYSRSYSIDNYWLTYCSYLNVACCLFFCILLFHYKCITYIKWIKMHENIIGNIIINILLCNIAKTSSYVWFFGGFFVVVVLSLCEIILFAHLSCLKVVTPRWQYLTKESSQVVGIVLPRVYSKSVIESRDLGTNTVASVLFVGAYVPGLSKVCWFLKT